MKICDITQLFSPNAGGGIQTFLEEKKRYILEKTNHSYVLINPGKELVTKIEGVFHHYSIPSVSLGKKSYYHVSFRLDLLYRILANEKPDIIEFHTPYLCQYPIQWQKMKNLVTIIGFYHADIPNTYIYPNAKKYLGENAARFLKKVSEKYIVSVYRNCDLVLIPSIQQQQKLESLNCCKTFFFPLGVDTEIFNPNKKSLKVRNHLGINDEECLLIYTGRMDEEKKVDFLIDSVKDLPVSFRYKLLLIGDGSIKDKLMEQAKENNRILFLPYIKCKKELATLLASSDIFLFAGPHETFGLSILEAQSCGLPVVGVRSGALMERVTEGLGLLCPVGSHTEFAQNIVKVHKENDFTLKYQIRKQIIENYSWDSRMQQLIRIYQEYAHETALIPEYKLIESYEN